MKFLLALTIIGNLKYNFTFLKNIPRKNNSGLSIAKYSSLFKVSAPPWDHPKGALGAAVR